MSNFKPTNKSITKAVMFQYEAIRQLGPCNMLDLSCVQVHAARLKFYDLAALEDDDYVYILMNFSDLITYYKVDQSLRPAELALQMEASI